MVIYLTAVNMNHMLCLPVSVLFMTYYWLPLLCRVLLGLEADGGSRGNSLCCPEMGKTQ